MTNSAFPLPVPSGSAFTKNLIFNGSFLLWQRATSFSTAGTLYGPDRWQVSGNGGTNGVFSQQPGPTSGTFYLRVQRNPGDTGTADLMVATSLTRDMCIGAAGNQLTLTFKVLCGANFSAALSQMTCQIYSGTGSTDTSIIGGFSGVVLQANPITTLTTVEQTITVNTLTLGTNVTTLAALFRYTPTGTAGANDWFEIRDVQLAIGPNIIGYEYVPLAQEIPRCQYFYCKSYNLTTNPGTVTPDGYRYHSWIASTAQRATFASFPVTMRITPTIVTYSPGAGGAGLVDYIGTGGVASFTTGAGQSSVGIGSNSGTSSTQMAYHFTADAEVL